MKSHPFFLSLILGLGVLALYSASFKSGATAADTAPDDSAREFVALHPGDQQFKYLSPDIVEAFPPGRSNAANDEQLKKYPLITDGWELDPKHYKFCVYEGDSYAVQWIFQSRWKDNGTIQREGTLAFGKVKNGKLVSWTEFFDDTVGELQHDGKMGTYTAAEEPYPWPAKPGYQRAYRSYDANSATWKNYPHSIAPAK